MPPDLKTNPPLSPSLVEHAECNISLVCNLLTGRLKPHYPKASVAVVFRGDFAHYMIETGRDRQQLYAHGFREADHVIDGLLDARPPTIAEIEKTLGADTAYLGNTHAA